MSFESRITHWIETGEHVITTDYIKGKVVGSASPVRTNPISIVQSRGDSPSDAASESSDDSSSEAHSQLVGCENDVLIPTPGQISNTFCQGQNTWLSLVTRAKLLPPGCMPTGATNPYIMMKDLPALPRHLPRARVLFGQPVWHVPNPEPAKGGGVTLDVDWASETPTEDEAMVDDDWDPKHVCGYGKEFILFIPRPTECRVSSHPEFFHYASTGPSDPPNGLAILTLCWAYILSVKQLEMQHRQVRYSQWHLTPVLATGFKSRPEDVALDLTGASNRLVRWLCAVLAPKLGWCVVGPLPPWAACCLGDIRFVILTDRELAFAGDDLPPNSYQAADLLIELCGLYGFGSDAQDQTPSSEPLPPCTAAFLAALALPWYSYMRLQPQLPVPRLRRRPIDKRRLGFIRWYVNDLRYYMTLSIHPPSLGSVLWSIFWQPGISCNLVSPWLGSILDVLRPIIDARDLEMLAKVFALRRPRVALWWLGIFLLGDPKMLDRIVSYLGTLEEEYGYGSLSPPDVAVAAWTGSPQSFWDEDISDAYPESTAQVPRADLLRHRLNLQLQDPNITLFSWLPFGQVAKKQVELELWPRLEHKRTREYLHWVWWIKKDEQTPVRDIQLGFRRDTGRHIRDVHDELEPCLVEQRGELPGSVKVEPSRQSTLRMLSHSVRDATGYQDHSIMAVPGMANHPWLRYWRGLE